MPGFLPSFYKSSSPSSSGDDTEQHARVSLKEVFKHYGFDWALVIFLWFFLSWLNTVEGHKREFSLDDKSIQHTFAVVERVPPGLLIIISAVIPLVSVLLISLFITRSSWDAHNSSLAVLMSYTMTGLATQLIKMSVGRPRPDLINRCDPPPGSHDAIPYGLSNVTICSKTHAGFILNDGFKSFPSGHSSLSFAGLGVLSFYLAGKLQLFGTRGHQTRVWVALTPLMGGIMVACSRTMDNRHHWTDVTVGSLLGLAIAFVAYRGYYPPLWHSRSHLPYGPREELDNSDGGLSLDRPGYAPVDGGDDYEGHEQLASRRAAA